jgi:hypothetical protein
VLFLVGSGITYNIRIGWKGLPETNVLAYFPASLVLTKTFVILKFSSKVIKSIFKAYKQIKLECLSHENLFTLVKYLLVSSGV